MTIESDPRLLTAEAYYFVEQVNPVIGAHEPMVSPGEPRFPISSGLLLEQLRREATPLAESLTQVVDRLSLTLETFVDSGIRSLGAGNSMGFMVPGFAPPELGRSIQSLNQLADDLHFRTASQGEISVRSIAERKIATGMLGALREFLLDLNSPNSHNDLDRQEVVMILGRAIELRSVVSEIRIQCDMVSLSIAQEGRGE